MHGLDSLLEHRPCQRFKVLWQAWLDCTHATSVIESASGYKAMCRPAGVCWMAQEETAGVRAGVLGCYAKASMQNCMDWTELETSSKLQMHR